MTDHYISTKEAASRAGIWGRTVRKLAARGKFPKPIMRGTAYCFREREVAAWLAKRTTIPEDGIKSAVVYKRVGIAESHLAKLVKEGEFTRLTNAFSKKIENHVHALSIYFMYYNFVRIHQSLRVTPAMAAGVTDRLWELEDIVALTD